MLRLQPAPLGGRQPLVGQLEAGQLIERLADTVELLFQVRAQRAQRRGASLPGAHHLQRLGHELAALPVVVRRAIGADQRQRFVAAQPMLLDRLAHGLLLVGLERAQRPGQPDAYRAGVDTLGHRFSQPLRQQQPRFDPAGLLAAHRGDGHGAELIPVA